MSKRREETENHWPGFVDALSTIVMVITFLLIILSIVIFILSQRMAKQYIDVAPKANKQGGVVVQNDKTPSSMTSKNLTVKNSVKNSTKAQSPKVTDLTTIDPDTKEFEASGRFVPKEGQILTQDEDIKSDTKLAIRSSNIIDKKKVVTIQEEKEKRKEKTRVRAAKALLTIKFSPAALNITQNAHNEIKEFIDSHVSDKERTLEIRSFASVNSNSISEARRIAYYRALNTRNVFIKNGFGAKKINIVIREAQTPLEQNATYIFVKPKE